MTEGLQMRIGVIKEVAKGEKRVILRPEEVKVLVTAGHEVVVESNAGLGVGFSDEHYRQSGAIIAFKPQDVFNYVDMVVKLKAPTPDEFTHMHDLTLFTMLHSEQNPEILHYLSKNNIKAIQMESVKNQYNERLIDATDITGEVGVMYALKFLPKIAQDLKVLILGYGRVGSHAIKMCHKLGMDVKILRREEFKDIRYFMKDRDLVINAISWPIEARKQKQYLITKDMLPLLNPNSVILDLSVDYPNPIESCRPTTLDQPWYKEEGVVHIGIYGYPGLVPESCTKRYSEQVLPLLLEVADNKGVEGLEFKSELGAFIKKAVVTVDKQKWEQVSLGEAVFSK